MTARQSRYSAEETARRGDALYEREIRGKVEPAYRGKVVAIDVDRANYVIADNALAASERLLAQYPDAEIWCVRVGSRVLHRMAARGALQRSVDQSVESSLQRSSTPSSPMDGPA